MQYYIPPTSNIHGAKFHRSNTFPQTEELDSFLLAHATDFVKQQNGAHTQVVHAAPQLQTHQRQHIHHQLTMQPYYSEQAIITPDTQHNQAVTDYSADDIDIDLYLTQQAEVIVKQTLNHHKGLAKVQYSPAPIQYSPPTQKYYKSPQYVVQPAPKIQYVQKAEYIVPQQQLPENQYIQYVQPHQHVQPRQHVQQVEYYVPQPQVQVKAQEGYLGTPYVVETQRKAGVPLPKAQVNEIVVPAPVIQREVVNAAPVRQGQQFQAVNTVPEQAQQGNMEFIQKGPKGEMLYKVNEGGVNYYVKTGLTEEAVHNYALAHLIGVGPPVEIIGTTGLKMEEGVNLRHAVRDKMISMEEVRAQIQGLHKTLFDTGMAHCDVKFENCLYFPKYKKVLLIDNGDLAVYGNRRKIKTPGANSTLLIHGNEERNMVGPATDLNGFMHIMKNATEEGTKLVE